MPHKANHKLKKCQPKQYLWWGQEGGPPDHLKTKKQLSEMSLKPKQAVGVICTKKYDCYLYDPDDPESAVPKRKSSPKQLAALERAREVASARADYIDWMRNFGGFEQDRIRAVRWVRNILADPSYIVLDTETTGLSDAEIVEIAVMDLEGKPLLNTLVKPQMTIPEEVIQIHGITDSLVESEPSFPDVYPKLLEALKGRKVIIYNADFDISIISYCCGLHSLPAVKFEESHCLMSWYARWYGDWSDYFGSYKWQPLCGGHRALSDCRAALERIKEMAADTDKFCFPKDLDLSLVPEKARQFWGA